jgi:hypothetical protein
MTFSSSDYCRWTRSDGAAWWDVSTDATIKLSLSPSRSATAKGFFMMGRPTKAVPAGVLVILFGVAAWIYAGFTLWAIHLAGLLPEGERDPALVVKLWGKFVVAFSLGVVLMRAGWRMALKADMSDPGNPQKPMLRF